MEEILNKILIKVVDMDERISLMEENMVTKNELKEAKGEILGDVDNFVKLHTTVDQELTMLRNKYTRLDDKVVLLEQKMVA